MAKEDKAKVKMTVIHFETESDNLTLQENIKAIAQTLTRALAPPQRTVNVPAQLQSSSRESVEHLSDTADYDAAVDADIITTEKPTRKSRSSARIRTPNVLEGIDFVSEPMPLKRFIEENKVQNKYSRRYLAIGYWFKKYRGLNEFTVEHIFTAYKFLGWGAPKKVNQPLHDLERKNKWLSRGSTNDTYVVNHIGENQMGNA